MPEFIKSLDIFSGSLPTFNIGGKDSVHTSVGALVSIIIMMLTLSFGLLKMQNLVNRKNPLLAANSEVLPYGETYSLASEEFMMAFALHKFAGAILDFDARYVRWIVRVWEDVAGERNEAFYPLHVCSEEEFSKFYTAESE